MSEPTEDMQAFLKQAAMIAVKHGVNHYDFRRESARALRKAAVDFEDGNKSAAAHRIKMSRNKIDWGLDD
jgi:hypothetical protein